LSRELENLLAKKFIARPDVKAIQHLDGSWSPHTDTGKRDGNRIPWRREDLSAHVRGQCTFGHYLVSRESECKLFAFDIDLEKTGILPTTDVFTATDENFQLYAENDLRGCWANRAHPARWYMKLQFKELAHKLMAKITEELDLPCTAAYSGGKGVHVYGFLPRLLPSSEAREGAKIVLDSVGKISLVKGDHFFKHEDYPNLSIEVYPKQDSLEGKDLGNLMRLPLGVNYKNPKDPTFFIDMTAPLGSMVPCDPIEALTKANPWE
jgi:hypothetical protein